MTLEKTFKWLGKYYHSNQGWGLYHPDYNYWYDPSCIKIVDDSAILNISTIKYDDKNFGAGQMVSKKRYLYGTFEWEYILPKGNNLWPAIWLTGAESWPPEIDVMEGWSHKNNYHKWLIFNDIMPNLHYDFDNKTYQKGSLGTYYTFRWLQSIDKVNKCKLVWTPDLIEISYNNHIIIRMTDKEILKYFNKPMLVIMNNAVTKDFTENNYKDYLNNNRPFRILSFTYEEL